MKRTAIRMTIQAAAADAWDVITDLSGVENYLPAISSSQVYFQDTNILRRITLMDGLQYEEWIDSIDHDNLVMTYTMADPSPFQYSSLKGIIKVTPVSDSSCNICWECTYEVEEELADEIFTLLTLIINYGIKGIERRCKRLVEYA